MRCIAHTKDGKTFVDESQCQPLETHLINVAKYAEQFADAFGAKNVGQLIGVLHDYGKYSESFQKKIRGENRKANHAMAGAYLDNTIQTNDPIRSLYGLLIAGHHTGMADFNQGDSGFRTKLQQYQPEKMHPIDPTVLQLLPNTIAHKSCQPSTAKQQISFAIAYYLKMLFSCLVDADFTDTEEFCSDCKRQPIAYCMDDLYELFVSKLPKHDGRPINTIRHSILQDCLNSADKPQGLFSLTVPTGGGKTISSLGFALRHAQKHHLSRIIYVIPYTSIIEQNAKVFQDILGTDYVLEHHSNMLYESEDFRIRWATENWDIPVIVTTNVQFFESIFSNRPSRNRKLHNIANSVIIFDEAQMLPKQYLSPCLYAISELVTNYKVTAVLCSATQPKIGNYIYHDLFIHEIIEDPIKLTQELKRVHYQPIGKQTDEELISLLLQQESGLLIVNSRRHAHALYEELKNRHGNTGEHLFCLSTLIPPIERRKKIKEIKELLPRENVYVISTQLIEAGVDIDFPVVFRALSGIDSMIQAGGRANREGRRDMGTVYIFEPASDSGKIPRSLENTAKIAKEVIDCLGKDAFELVGIEKYFDLLYSTTCREGRLDEKNILDEFELAAQKWNFQTVSKKFKIIEDTGFEVIIPLTEDASHLVLQLQQQSFHRQTIRKLSQYSVSVYSKEFSMLQQEHSIENVNGFYVLSNIKRYNTEIGLDVFSTENFNGEAYIT